MKAALTLAVLITTSGLATAGTCGSAKSAGGCGYRKSAGSCGYPKAAAQTHHKKDILGTAEAAGSFSTLVAAVKAAGLEDALKGKGPFTVFAPTDAAFSKLPDGTVPSLLKKENIGRLAEILKYHVVAGRFTSDKVVNATGLRTLAGRPLTIDAEGGTVAINQAGLVKADILATNGVIHVIDQVLLPETLQGNAAARIERTIEQGVPMFNGGDHKGTAALYMDTAKELLQHSGLTMGERAALRDAVHRAEIATCYTSKAWALRSGLDAAHASAGGPRMHRP